MISPTELEDLKARLRQSVVKDVEATFTILKEALPVDSSRLGEVLTLEGRYHNYKKEKLRHTLSTENAQLIDNQIRAGLVDFITALEIKDFEPVRQSMRFTPGRKPALYLLLALIVGSLIAVAWYLSRADTPAWFPLPTNKSGHLLYKIPATMALNQESECVVRIAFDSVELVRDLTLDNVKLESIRTSNKMKVELMDAQAEPAFRIRNILADDEQFIEHGDYTEWRFGVIPLLSGTHKLVLKVTVLKKIDGEYVPKNLSFSKDIEIVADAPTRVEATFENSGQLLSESSADALVQTIEEERQDFDAIADAIRDGAVDWSEMLSGWNEDIALSGGKSTSGQAILDSTMDWSGIAAGGSEWVSISSGKTMENVSTLAVHFPYNSAEWVTDSLTNEVFMSLVVGTRFPDARMVLVGHTDDRGSLDYNLNLGLERAEAIRATLIRLGAEKEKISIRSEGESQPITSNALEKGRAQNRRVEIQLFIK